MSDWDMNGDTTRAGYAAEIADLKRQLAEFAARVETLTKALREARMRGKFEGSGAHGTLARIDAALSGKE